MSDATEIKLGPLGWMRWGWRQLTSMRTALILLFLLAVASIPGSVFPQRGVNPIKVREYIDNSPVLGEWLSRLGFFDVFGSVWFSAIYLLLCISLAGCVLPRTRQHWRAMRAQPPAVPSRLERFEDHRDLPDARLDDAEQWLRSNRWRVRRTEAGISAEKGYLRETGNLVFHISLLLLLFAVGIGSGFGWKGQVIVTEGRGFSNIITQYDSFTPGRFVTTDSLAPFSFELDSFKATYLKDGPRVGQPEDYAAGVTYTDVDSGRQGQADIRVNSPLNIDGTKVFLLAHGFAPIVTIKDARGQTVFDDSVVFLPQDGNLTSTGVIKVPDALPQLGFQGIFLPTAKVDPERGPISSWPEPLAPGLFLSAWQGDLGLDDGVPQSVYQLQTDDLKRIGIKSLTPGQTWKFDGGELTLVGYKQWASFSIAHDPGKNWALLASMASIAGLMLSLFVKRRRLWVKELPDGSGLELAALGRNEGTDVAADLDLLCEHCPRG